MPRLDKHALRTLGFALIIMGFLLLLITLLYSSVTNCPANGCPAVGSPWVGVFVFFSGIALVITGVILLIVARRMKPNQAKGKWADVRVLGRKEARIWIPNPMTFEEAKALSDAYVVMTGDHGGQCYLTAPLRLISRQEHELRQLLQDIDKIFWQYAEGQRLYYEQHMPGDSIGGGMGGGLILDDVWIHKQLVEFGLETQIRKVLSGELPGLELSEEELKRLRERLSSIEERERFKSQ